MFDPVIAWLTSIAEHIDPALFGLVGSFVEEILAPIPSPLIMATIAGLAQTLHFSWMYLVWILIISAVGKTVASYIVYVIADKSEDLVVGRFGKYLGISHSSIEGIGRHLNKGHWDDVVLIILRALPVVPSVVVSVSGGVLKLNMKTFLYTTFVGTLIRNAIYFSIVYFGWSQAEAMWAFFEDRIELLAVATIGLLVMIWIARSIKSKIEERILNPNADDSDQPTST